LDIKDLAQQINQEKLDSRLKYKQVTHATQPYERVYCILCSAPHGWVSQESYKFIKASNIIVICDDCIEGLGQEPPLERAII